VQVTSLDLERRALANINLGLMYEGARSADEDGARNLLYISSRWVCRELKKKVECVIPKLAATSPLEGDWTDALNGTPSAGQTPSPQLPRVVKA
jgi:hypothetical protein